MTVKGLRYVKIDSANPLYPIINKINGYSKEDNRNKYLTLVRTNESKITLKKYEELTQTIIMKNIKKLNLIEMMIYL